MYCDYPHPHPHRHRHRHCVNKLTARPVLMIILAAVLYAAPGLQQARAVVPYRSPEDYGPSIEARRHLPECRRAAMQAMAGKGKIESESFTERGDAEYFRFVIRDGGKEVLIICDGHAGIIRRKIDIWGNL